MQARKEQRQPGWARHSVISLSHDPKLDDPAVRNARPVKRLN